MSKRKETRKQVERLLDAKRRDIDSEPFPDDEAEIKRRLDEAKRADQEKGKKK